MTTTLFQHVDILAARQAYAEGRNVTEVLREQMQVAGNTSEIIEVAYDLQAGTYIAHTEENLERARQYTGELAGLLDRYLRPEDSLLDIGCGELTTLSLLSQQLDCKPRHIFAFDISWSRLHTGLAYARKTMGEHYPRLHAFVADIGAIPLRDKSVDVVTSSHALEPNGARLAELLAELFRVTRRTLVLFEPGYEINSAEGQARMDRLGYIKDVAGVVARLGGELIETVQIEHTGNPLNPTVGFMITPPASPARTRPGNGEADSLFSVPGTDKPLQAVEGFYFSNETGLCFPVLKSIPVLKSNAAILASALCV